MSHQIMVIGIIGAIGWLLFAVAIIWARRKESMAGSSGDDEATAITQALVANIAHDLRTPLTSIQGYIETLIERDATLASAERREYLGIVHRNTKTIRGMVHDLLALAKFDAQVERLQLESFSVVDLASDLVSKFKVHADQKGVELILVAPPTLPQVWADLRMIERAVSNFISNAIRYTPRGGKVFLEFEDRGNRVLTRVRDTGIGIPPDEVAHVAERFYRVNKDRSRETGGVGLGLAISDRILKLHRSLLLIESKVGVGTSVSFELAIKPGATPR